MQKKWSEKYKKSIDCNNPKGFSQKAHCQGKMKRVNEEGLRDWFGKSKSKDGKKGWVNVVTGGTCASDEPGEGTPKCVSSAKRASMTKAERLSAQRRKKKADPGQQQKTGAAKPTYVSTDPKKKMKKEEKDHEVSMAHSQLNKAEKDIKKLKKGLGKKEKNLPAWMQAKITDTEHNMDAAASYVGEAKDKPGKGSGKKDACYHKVKSRYSVWPSAYASGALVKCRKVGAANWGNKSEEFMALPEMTDIQINAMRKAGIEVEVIDEKCWKGYEKKGMKTMFGKRYPNCVKKEENEVEEKLDIDKAIKKPGALKKQLGVPEDEKIPADKLDAAAKKGGKLGQRARFAQTLRGFNEDHLNEDVKAVEELEERLLELNDISYDSIDKLMRSICEDHDMTPRELHDEFKSKHDQTPDSWIRSQKNIDEAVRIPSKTGNIYLVGFSWRGKYMMMKLFFPEVKRPTRDEVQSALDGIYPGCNVMRYDMTPYQPGEQLLHVEESEIEEGAAWTRKEGKNKSGGLNEKGRKSYERENPGSDLKAPSKKVGNPRRASFCARMKGMKKKLTSKKTASDPDSRINKSLRAWNC